MKTFVISAIMSILFLAGCKTGVFPVEGGKDDVAFISVVSSGSMANKDVVVYVDDSTKFTAHVQKAKQSTEKHNGIVYSILPGRRHVKVIYEGVILYEKDVFLSSQQTKIINL